MPNWRHCWTIIEPARVITGRASPSTITRIVNGLPSGVIQLSPRFVNPAFSSNSFAATGSVFHQPMPIDAAICLGSLGIWSPIDGRSMLAICWPIVAS